QRERARPKPANQRLPRRGKLRHQIFKLGDPADMYDERVIPGPALRGKNSGHRFLRPGIGAQSVNRFRREGHHFPLPEHAGRFPVRPASPQRTLLPPRFAPPPKRRLAHMSSSFPAPVLSLSYRRSRFSPSPDQRSSSLEGARSRGWMPTVTFYSLLPLGPSPY